MEALERLVFLDTETTGLDPRLGHRIIEVACLEAIGRELTQRSLHFYLDPEREIDPAATAVHGLTWDDLRDKPKFRTVADELMEFLRGARVIIHNAPFDVSFIDQELSRLRAPPMAKRELTITDSLMLAREKYPGKRNSLDALCDRLGVNNSHRQLHGALLDARLLAEVYFAMTRGQGMLDMGSPEQAVAMPLQASDSIEQSDGEPIELAAIEVDAAALQAHEQLLAGLAKQSGVSRVW